MEKTKKTVTEAERLVEVDLVEFEHDGYRYRHVAPDRQVLRLAITQWRCNPDGAAPTMVGWDSRDETWETLVERNDWGAFRDVAGFDPDDREIQSAVDAAIAELRAIRAEAAAYDGRRLKAIRDIRESAQ